MHAGISQLRGDGATGEGLGAGNQLLKLQKLLLAIECLGMAGITSKCSAKFFNLFLPDGLRRRDRLGVPLLEGRLRDSFFVFQVLEQLTIGYALIHAKGICDGSRDNVFTHEPETTPQYGANMEGFSVSKILKLRLCTPTVQGDQICPYSLLNSSAHLVSIDVLG